jgi:hypothetical protein
MCVLNIKIDLRVITCKGVDCVNLEPLGAFCEHGNEPSFSVNTGNCDVAVCVPGFE